MMLGLKIANMGLAFIAEITMWVAFGYWGYQLTESPLKWIYGIGIATMVIVAWGIWAAPKSKKRLQQPGLIVFKMILFILATLALIHADQTNLAIILLVASVVNQAIEYYTDTHPQKNLPQKF